MVSDVSQVALQTAEPGESGSAQVPVYDLIELFFFAYRDFVSDPDRILADFSFGRAHHRVLHFVDRQPGLTIAELLDILRITKQSLNRVLKELIEKGFIESRTGTLDRRQRLLFATDQGHELALRMAKLQTRRIMRALSEGPDDLKGAASRFLLAMIDASDRAHVRRLVFGPGTAA
jgi:DNA-binding MarR family transcriptional regulator